MFEATLRNSRILSEPVKLTVSGTAAINPVKLQPGLYSVTCDVDCFFLQGDVNTVAATTSAILWAKERGQFEVRDSDGYFSVIQKSSGGEFWIQAIQA